MDYELLHYEVKWRGNSAKKTGIETFYSEESAVEFGREMVDKGFKVTITKIEYMVGWIV